MRILITGDSHTGALKRGLVALDADQQLDPAISINVRALGGGHLLPTPFFADAGDHAQIIDPTYQKMLARLPPTQPKYDAIALSMPLWPMRMVYRFNSGKLALPNSVSTGRRPISYAAFRVLVLDEMQYVLELIDLLQRNGIAVAAVSPPHLFRDHNTLKSQPVPDLVHLWQSYLDVMRDTLAARNVTVIEIPDACKDTEGLMLTDYRHDDPEDMHHGNAKLGALMIKAVETWGKKIVKGGIATVKL
jgi:hypothetical protein